MEGSNTLISLNAQSVQNSLRMLPRAPVLSSEHANWQNAWLVHHHQPACDIPEHCLPYHQICIKLGNPHRLEQVIDGRPEAFQAVPGGIGLYLANRNQSCCWYEEAEFLQVYLDPKTLMQISEETWGSDRRELIPQPPTFIDPLILQIGLALKASLENEGAASHLYADSMTHALAIHLLARYSAQKAATPTVQGRLSPQQTKQVIDFIQQNLDQNLRLATLAAIVQISPYHFARLFKQSTGLPPHRYQTKCRIDRAKELLSSGKFAIAEVAQIVGFSSQGHLNHHFKRLTGRTPKAFLRP